MPTVFRHGGFRFFFYSNEGWPREPAHIHVRSSDGEAKFWLRPDVVVAESYGLSASALSALSRLVDANRALIERAWNEHFGD